MAANKELLNVIIMSCGFMLIFAAYLTTINIEKTVLKNIAKEDPSFSGDGYISLAIIHAAFAVGFLLAPSCASKISSKSSILIGAISNVLFIVMFFWPETYFLYTVSAIKGLGGSLIWYGHGQFITENSQPETVNRNSGIFFAIYELCFLPGNLLIYFAFTDINYDQPTRDYIFLMLTILSVIGTLTLATLKKSDNNSSKKEDDFKIENNLEGFQKSIFIEAWEDMKRFFNLSITSNMILLTPIFIYSGLVIAFYSAVYPSCVGFTMKIGESRKQLMNIVGCCMAVGGIPGSILSGPLSSKIKIQSIWMIAGIGLLTHTIAYVIVFLNLPNNSPFEDTEDVGFIAPLPVLAIIAAIAIGFGDACFNTQIISFLSTYYVENNGPATAVFYFHQTVSSTIAFFYSNYIGLYVQLAILFFVGIVATACFNVADFKVKRREDCNSIS